MQGINYQTATENAIQPKFKGRKRIKSRYSPRYPISAEREYRRVKKAYFRILGRELRKSLPSIMSAYKREMRKDSREDGLFDFIGMLHTAILAIATEISLAMEEFALQEKVEKIAKMVQNRSVSEWIASVKGTLGVDLLPDYYKGDTYEQVIKRWIADNLAHTQGVPLEILLGIEALIKDSYREGIPPEELEEKLQKQYSAAVNRAEFSARDQVGTLNASLMQMQQKDAGIGMYMWLSERDGRVRDCHQEFDGHVFTWDDPPEDWHVTKYGVVYSGERFNPGEAYGCRCCAVPVFEKDGMILPIKSMPHD